MRSLTLDFMCLQSQHGNSSSFFKAFPQASLPFSQEVIIKSQNEKIVSEKAIKFIFSSLEFESSCVLDKIVYCHTAVHLMLIYKTYGLILTLFLLCTRGKTSNLVYHYILIYSGRYNKRWHNYLTACVRV